jgi:hypothetical protein
MCFLTTGPKAMGPRGCGLKVPAKVNPIPLLDDSLRLLLTIVESQHMAFTSGRRKLLLKSMFTCWVGGSWDLSTLSKIYKKAIKYKKN